MMCMGMQLLGEAELNLTSLALTYSSLFTASDSLTVTCAAKLTARSCGYEALRPGQVPLWSAFEEGRDDGLLPFYLFSEQKLCPLSCLIFTPVQKKHFCSPLCYWVLRNL